MGEAMTNKIEISRELAQKVDDLLYIMTGHDSYPRLVHKYGKEWWTPINEMRAEICTLLAASVVERQEPVAVVLPRYTCIGKGGEYERLGYAKPSGALRTIHGESGIIVYRDIATGQLYFRDPADFQQRMACLDKVKELNQ